MRMIETTGKCTLTKGIWLEWHTKDHISDGSLVQLQEARVPGGIKLVVLKTK